MIRKNTWWLLGITALIVAYTLTFEVDRRPLTPEMPEFLPDFKPETVHAITIDYQGTNALTLARQTGRWQLKYPVPYPANSLGPESLINRLTQLRPLGHRQLDSAEFGFNPPAVKIRLTGPDPVELHLGDLTPLRDKIYAQVPGQEGIFILPRDILNVLPGTAEIWRDHDLFHLGASERLAINLLHIRSGPRHMALRRVGSTNQIWQIEQPSPVKRANAARVEELLQKIWNWPVVEFITDDPKADLEPYGLHSPEAELALLDGTNRLAAVQFGHSPTNQPGLVFARILNHTNVVVIEKPHLELLREPVWHYADHHLVDAFTPDTLEHIEIQGGEPFSLQQSTNGTWRINEPNPLPADADLVLDLLVQLRTLRATSLEREVVGDYAEFGLIQPSAQFTLRERGGTNAIISQLSFGTPKGEGGDQIYARRSDESAVYAVAAGLRQRLPSYVYQLRDRQLWQFRHEDITKLAITSGEHSTELLRNNSGEWTRTGHPLSDEDRQSIPSALSVLGRLRAVTWTARGADKLAQYGILDPNKSITLEFTRGGQSVTRKVQFGRLSPAGNPYAFATDPLDQEPVIFEFPANTYNACDIILFPLVAPEQKTPDE